MSPFAAALAAAWLAPAADLQVKPTDWPQFRGPNRDALSPDKGLLKSWPDGGPKKLYTVTGLGGGYSTVAVVGGMIFGTGKKDGKEVVFARKESDGSEVWATPFADAKKVGYDEGTRSTPTYANGKVYAVGMAGDLVCLDAASGKEVWRKSYTKDFGGSVQAWGYSESVLVDGNKVIGTPCSASAAVVALNADTGALLWKTPVPKPGGAGGYASPIKVTLGNVSMYVTLLGKDGGVVGVDAKTGKLLWQYNRIMNGTANIPAVVSQGDKLFASTGYGDGGAALLQLVPGAGGVTVKELKYYPAKELQNHHGGMVLVGDHVYLGRGHNNGLPTCVEMKTGKIAWAEDRGIGGGNGTAAIAAADGLVYVRYENHVMAAFKADPAAFEAVGSFKLPEWSGKKSWPHPTIANGKLFIRDQDKLHVFDLRAQTN
jgi:outer membrane protein assembly factor BamB